MIKPSTKIKRGTKLTIIETGEIVTLNRIKENGNYFCDFDNGSYQSFDVTELKLTTKINEPINKVSESKKEEDKVYVTIRKVFLNNHRVCEAKILGCLHSATEVHHKKGRVGKNYLDVHTFLALCGNCHRWIETHPEWAKEHGYSLDRL